MNATTRSASPSPSGKRGGVSDAVVALRVGLRKQATKRPDRSAGAYPAFAGRLRLRRSRRYRQLR